MLSPASRSTSPPSLDPPVTSIADVTLMFVPATNVMAPPSPPGPPLALSVAASVIDVPAKARSEPPLAKLMGEACWIPFRTSVPADCRLTAPPASRRMSPELVPETSMRPLTTMSFSAVRLMVPPGRSLSERALSCPSTRIVPARAINDLPPTAKLPLKITVRVPKSSSQPLAASKFCCTTQGLPCRRGGYWRWGARLRTRERNGARRGWAKHDGQQTKSGCEPPHGEGHGHGGFKIIGISLVAQLGFRLDMRFSF